MEEIDSLERQKKLIENAYARYNNKAVRLHRNFNIAKVLSLVLGGVLCFANIFIGLVVIGLEAILYNPIKKLVKNKNDFYFDKLNDCDKALNNIKYEKQLYADAFYSSDANIREMAQQKVEKLEEEKNKYKLKRNLDNSKKENNKSEDEEYTR